MTVVAMSHGEFLRYDMLLRVKRGELRVATAAVLLGLARWQISRLLFSLSTDGVEGLVFRKRGSQSNRRLSDEFHERYGFSS